MLSAYEDFSKYFDTLKTNIPESNDAVPDILNELIYNLRWMLTMQDPNDGGVYHKCTNAAFDGMVMPGITTAPRYAVQKGVAATLDFAAVAAQASRILQKYQKQLPGLSDSCLKAAVNAWQWAEKILHWNMTRILIIKSMNLKLQQEHMAIKTFQMNGHGQQQRFLLLQRTGAITMFLIRRKEIAFHCRHGVMQKCQAVILYYVLRINYLHLRKKTFS